jgi:hypothetical protein
MPKLHKPDPSGQGGVRNNGWHLVRDDGQMKSAWNKWMGRMWSSGFQRANCAVSDMR